MFSEKLKYMETEFDRKKVLKSSYTDDIVMQKVNFGSFLEWINYRSASKSQVKEEINLFERIRLQN